MISQIAQVLQLIWLNHILCFEGCNSQVEQHYLQIVGFAKGSVPFRYLGVPITTTILSTIECGALVEKTVSRVKIWSSRHFSYAGRIVLINTVLFGMYNYQASIFILPREVVDPVVKVCRITCGDLRLNTKRIHIYLATLFAHQKIREAWVSKTSIHGTWHA